MSSGKLSREEFRKQKELEEARKAGTAPAEIDEEGHEINPHIPQYISKAPWYIDTGAPTLKHQKVQKTDTIGHDLTIQRKGVRGEAATKFRPGACTNCGALTHKVKECTERPRRIAAKFSGSDIKPDEVLIEAPSEMVGFEGKRDRWNGYDPTEYEAVIKSYEYIEQERKKMKEEEMEKKFLTDAQKPADEPSQTRTEATTLAAATMNEEGEGEGEGEEDDIDEEKYAEQTDAVGQKVDLKSRMTVRNLRIREDTAKYLRNLDPESAYYDPKTRSMRENPNKDVHPSQLAYAGDNFVRYTGEATHVNQLQLFCWEASEKGLGVHVQAAPSETEKKYKQFTEKKDVITTEVNKSILEKYGGAEYLVAPPKEILYGASGESEVYVEYSKSGDVIRGVEKAIPRSKYTENVYINNHTSVWGSYWEKGNWGYACCHSFIRNSYCSGEAGKEAHKESVRLAYSS